MSRTLPLPLISADDDTCIVLPEPGGSVGSHFEVKNLLKPYKRLWIKVSARVCV